MYKHSAADTDSALITDWFGDDCSLREQSIPVQLHCKNIKNSRNIHKKKLILTLTLDFMKLNLKITVCLIRIVSIV